VKIIYVLTLLFLVILDWYVFIHAIYYNLFDIFWFSGLHAVIVLASIYATRSIKKRPYFDDYLSLVLPGIGLSIILFISILEALGIENEMMEEELSGASFMNQLYAVADINPVEELNTLSVADSLTFSSDEAKKAAVVQFSIDDIAVKVRILKKALKDDNPEVVHYAASTLNFVEAELESKINTLKGEYSYKKEPDILVKLAETIKSYVDSGLLEDELLKVFLADYITVIDELRDHNRLTSDLLVDQAETYFKLRRFNDATKILVDQMEGEEGNPKAYLLLMEIYYDLKKSDLVSEMAQHVMQSELVLDENQQSRVEFWVT
jgi:hypothetical protein